LYLPKLPIAPRGRPGAEQPRKTSVAPKKTSIIVALNFRVFNTLMLSASPIAVLCSRPRRSPFRLIDSASTIPSSSSALKPRKHNVFPGVEKAVREKRSPCGQSDYRRASPLPPSRTSVSESINSRGAQRRQAWCRYGKTAERPHSQSGG
jgi:hypothetical protein